MPAHETNRRNRPFDGAPRPARTSLAAAAIVTLVLVAYLPALQAGYIWDDDSYLTANPQVQAPDGLARIWVPGYTPQYYPVVFTSFWTEYALWGLKPMGYHLVNILLHAVNALLVWRVARQLGLPGAWMIGAVFAVHPVHVESVAWITERKNVLSGCFYLLALGAYLRFDENRQAAGRNARDPWGWYAAALLLFVAALLSKSITCSLPAALILVMLYLRRPLTWRQLWPLVPMFGIGVLAAVNTVLMERVHVGAQGPEWDLSFLQRVLIASRALLFYPAKLLWPQPLLFIYPRWTMDAGDLITWWRPVVVLMVAAAAAALWWVRGRRGPLLALAFYAGTVFPALGFFNVFPHRFSFVADHFQYLASLGIIVLIVTGVARSPPHRSRVRIGLGAVVLAVLAGLTHLQARTYRTAETIWMDTLAKDPESWMPHTHMAVIRLRQLGDVDRHAEPEAWRRVLAEARGHAERAVELKPDDPLVLGKLSEALRIEGRYDEAFEFQSRAIRLLEQRYAGQDRWPRRQAEELIKLARLYRLRSEPGQAEVAYRRAMDTDPRSVLARYELAGLLARQQRLAEAIELLRTVLSLPGEHFEALVGLLSEQRGDLAATRRYREAAVRAARTPLEQIRATIALARFLATCPDPSHRDVTRALQIAETANRATDRRYPSLLDVLAEAQFAARRTDEAIATATEARDLARRVNATDLAQEIDQKLERYRAGTPTGPAAGQSSAR